MWVEQCLSLFLCVNEDAMMGSEGKEQRSRGRGFSIEEYNCALLLVLGWFCLHKLFLLVQVSGVKEVASLRIPLTTAVLVIYIHPTRVHLFEVSFTRYGLMV